MMVVRSIEAGERLLPDKEAIGILEQPNNCDEAWFKKSNTPPVPTPAEVAAKAAAQRQAELAFEWARLSQLVRSVIRLAGNTQDAGHRQLLLGLARAMCAERHEPGEPPAIAAQFFGREIK
jgi:hypothetical protein